jgi:hypothetical protein
VSVVVPVPDEGAIDWQVKPAGDEDAAKVIWPVKPPTAVTEMVEDPELPEKIAAGVTIPAEIEKSWAAKT